MLRILIICVRLASELIRSWFCCLILLNVISFCRFQLNDGVRCIPRYVYGSFWELYVMFCDWIYALKVVGLSSELLGHPVMTHFERLRSIFYHSTNLWSLVICSWMFCILFVIIARSSTYAIVMHVEEDVLKWYPMLSFSSYFRRESRKTINRYRLRVSFCIVPRLISIGSVVPK